MTTTLAPLPHHHRPTEEPKPLPESVVAPFPPFQNMEAITGTPDAGRPMFPTKDEQSIVRLCLACLVQASNDTVYFTPEQTAVFLRAGLLVFAEGKDAGMAESLTAL